MEKGYTWRVHSSDGTYIGDVWETTEDNARNAALYWFGDRIVGEFSVRRED